MRDALDSGESSYDARIRLPTNLTQRLRYHPPCRQWDFETNWRESREATVPPRYGTSRILHEPRTAVSFSLYSNAMTDIHTLTRKLQRKNDSKIILYVGDGLGGLPLQPGGKTELETANTPNLNALAQRASLGMSIPVLPGIAPGSGPGHLGLFGYDPLQYDIGRGVLEALGIDFELGPNDVAIRGNYCTVDGDGNITDRRAGRIASDIGAKLCEKLDQIEIPGVEVFVKHVKEYRLVIVFRGEGLGGDVDDTDPQRTGVPPLAPKGNDAPSQKTAEICAEFLRQAAEVLQDDAPANLLTMRGIAKMPPIPTFEEVYGTRAAAVAVYPMYRGLARLVGMDRATPFIPSL